MISLINKKQQQVFLNDTILNSNQKAKETWKPLNCVLKTHLRTREKYT